MLNEQRVGCSIVFHLKAIRIEATWLKALAKEGRPTAVARTWLLAGGWRRGGGLIAVDDVPG